MYASNDVRGVHLEMTTRCNARCPMCPRNLSGGRTTDHLPLAELTLDDIKRALPEDFVRQLRWLYMCGNYGDAIAARDTLEVFEYLRRANTGLKLRLITNGGGRDAAWWKKLAGVVNHCTFSVDGLEDTNHLYRRGVDWRRLMTSIESFLAAGGKADWDFLVFKHNEHQVERARELSRALGFSTFNVKRTSRFLQAGRPVDSMPVLDENGRLDYLLEMPTDEAMHNAAFGDFKSAAAAGQTYGDYLRTTQVDCKVLKNAQIYISGEGHVFPCCWTAKLYDQPARDGEAWRFVERLPRGLADLDAKIRPIQEIIDGPYFQSVVPATWPVDAPDRKAVSICTRACGVRDAIRGQLIAEKAPTPPK